MSKLDQTGSTRAVIILHGIGTPGRQLEPKEDVFWLTRDTFCRVLDRIADMGAAAPQITFDDGNASDIEIALPELERRDLTATFFLLTGRLGTPGSLAEADVTAIARAGYGIGLHGCDHVDWRYVDARARTRELVTARERLAALSGQTVDRAAAPFGLYNRQTLRDLRSLGFSALYTSDRGLAQAGAFIRPRNCLEGTMSPTALADALQGRVGMARRSRRLLGIARKRLLPVRTRP